MDAEVIIVGAGLSGLQAARKLGECNIRVIVVEARDRVGGRTFTVDRSGFPIDLGAGYVGPTQKRLISLADELGVLRKPTKVDDNRIVESGGKRAVYKGVIPWGLSYRAMLELHRMQSSLELQSRSVPLEAPWTVSVRFAEAVDAISLDSTTVEQWKRKIVSTAESRGLIDATCRTLVCMEPSEVSLLYFLWLIHSAGSFEQIVGDEGCAQAETFVGGAQQLAVGLASKLPSNVQVMLSHPVARIIQDAAGVCVVTSTGRQLRGRCCILALAPTLVQRIQFEPQLQPNKIQMFQRMAMGSVYKTFMVYKEAWWRNLGFAGTILSDQGPVTYSFESVCADGRAAIMGFVVGQKARELSKLWIKDREAAIKLQYQRMFKSDLALQNIDYVEKNWAEEEFSGGCYMSCFAPGALTAFGCELRRRENAVIFGGTETAVEWSGYMEGALQAGERAAAEASRLVLQRMGRSESAPSAPGHILSADAARKLHTLLSTTDTVSTQFLAASAKEAESYLRSNQTGCVKLSVLLVACTMLLLGIAVKLFWG